MTNQEFRKEANKLFDKVEYINENSGFISASLELHHLKGLNNEPFYSLTLRTDLYRTKDTFLYASTGSKDTEYAILKMHQVLDAVIEGVKEVVR
jgi:hypothetical protein|nr:MAG TPA: hypothetical protein [Caudoviricetes sp.]